MVTETNVEDLEKVARSVAEVLAKHNVFGVVAEDASEEEKAELDRYVAHEKEHFVGMVLRNALDPMTFLPVTMKYHDTGAWVRFSTHVMAGTALFKFIDAVPTLSPNPNLVIDPKIDYEALVEEIQFVREYSIME